MSEDSSKLQFLKDFGDDYGYPNSLKNIDQIRSTEFKRLDGLLYQFLNTNFWTTLFICLFSDFVYV